jgi:hypothetical protein
MNPAIACLLLTSQIAPDLDPREYASPSGEYVLRIDPSARNGSGPGTYSLRKGGSQVWGRELHFTLRDAVVADDGTSAGFGHPETGYDAEGELVVALLSPSGEVLLEDRMRRAPGPHIHSSPVPNPIRTFLQPESRRATVRIEVDDFDSVDEVWWTYELEPPHRRTQVDPRDSIEDSKTMECAFDVRALPGTPLILAHWSLWDWPEVGARFVLHDADHREVWRLDLPTDYMDGSEEDELLDAVREQGAILATAPGRFELRFFRDAERATFQVRRDPRAATEWSVVEIAREAFTPPVPEPAVAIATLALPLIERVRLGGSSLAEASVVRDVRAFDVDSHGGVRFIRRKRTEPVFTAVALSPDGELVSEVALEPLPADVDENVHWAPLAGDDWLLVGCTWSHQETGRSLAWRLDGTTGALVPLPSFAADTVEALAPLADGGFAALSTSRGVRMYDVLSVHDSDGRPRWAVGTHDFRGQVLFSHDDLATSGAEVLALLSTHRKKVELFDLDGDHLSTIDLEDAWSQEPHYPTGIATDVDGGFMVLDPRGTPAIWRMTSNRKVRASLRPRFADGSTPDVLARRLQLGGDGRMWTTDGSAFHRLDEAGMVDRSVGALPQADRLEQPGSVELDHLGRVMVQDARTGAIHVFDSSGSRLFVCRPDPTDYERVGDSNRLRTSGDGDLHVQRGGDYLVFGQDGVRRGVRRLAFAHGKFRPGSDERWSAEFHGTIRRIDASGDVGLELTRRRDGAWLQPRDLDVLPDGSIVVYENGEAGSNQILVFDREGRELRAIELPQDERNYHVRATARWAVVSRYAPRAMLVDLDSGTLFRVEPNVTSPEKALWELGFSPDGTELWWIRRDTLELLRFALPAD